MKQLNSKQRKVENIKRSILIVVFLFVIWLTFKSK
jgi:hypothetical protein